MWTQLEYDTEYNNLMDIAAIIGTIIASLAGSSVLVTLINRRRTNRTADVADTEKITAIVLSMLPPLKAEIEALKCEIVELKNSVAEHQKTITQQLRRIVDLQGVIESMSDTIRNMQAMVTVKDQQLIERDRVIVHMQGEINLMLAKINRLEKVQTGELHSRKNGV
jgi:chromosome segregation ATPase